MQQQQQQARFRRENQNNQNAVRYRYQPETISNLQKRSSLFIRSQMLWI